MISSPPLLTATPTLQYSSIGISTLASPKAKVSSNEAPKYFNNSSIAWALSIPLTPKSPNKAISSAPPQVPGFKSGNSLIESKWS